MKLNSIRAEGGSAILDRAHSSSGHTSVEPKKCSTRVMFRRGKKTSTVSTCAGMVTNPAYTSYEEFKSIWIASIQASSLVLGDFGVAAG